MQSIVVILSVPLCLSILELLNVDVTVESAIVTWNIKTLIEGGESPKGDPSTGPLT